MIPGIPKALDDAQKKGVEFFEDDDHEWKLEFEHSSKQIEKVVGMAVFVFANNGFGDYLFLKQSPNGSGFTEEVFKFLHEGAEIEAVKEDLETLLGLKDRTASSDNYPKAIYDTGEPIQIGDRVKIKVWVEFWKGWQDGEVKYVPGISKRKPANENNGLKWIEVRFKSGKAGCLVDPKTGKVRKLKFVERGNSG